MQIGYARSIENSIAKYLLFFLGRVDVDHVITRKMQLIAEAEVKVCART